MKPIINKLVEDIRAKECEYGLNGMKVQISFGFDEAQTLLSLFEQPSETDVLDKIRAEISENADRLKDSLYGDGLRHALEIIDKYKEESEEKNEI